MSVVEFSYVALILG